MTSGSTTSVILDTALYRLVAIKKAAYRIGDRCSVALQALDGGRVEVTLHLTGSGDYEQLLLDFQRELLDQELREVVAEETREIRNLLLAQAFSATSLVDPVGETADYRSDPLKVAIQDGPGTLGS